MKFFLFLYFLFFAVYPSFVKAEIPFEQASGVYTSTHEDQRGNSVFWGMVACHSKILERIRFFGNSGSIDETSSFFPKAWMVKRLSALALPKAIESADVPKDAISALIQHLFRSPDGVIFGQNENRGEAVVDLVHNKEGEVDFSKMNTLLKIVIEAKKQGLQQDFELLKERIFNVFEFSTTPVLTENLLLNIAKIHHIDIRFNQLPEYAIKSILKSLKNDLKQKNNKKERLQKSFLEAQNFQNNNQIEKLNTEIEKISQEINILDNEIHGLENGTLKENSKKIIAYEDITKKNAEELKWTNDSSRKVFLARVFAYTLAEALRQEMTQSKNPLYPDNICVLSLVSYVWKMGNSREDLAKLTYLMDAQKLIQTPLFSGKAYTQEIKKFQENLASQLQTTPEFIEKIALFKLGYSNYEDIVPDPVGMNYQVKYQDQVYPDCGETALRNFLYMIWNNKETGMIHLPYLENIANWLESQQLDSTVMSKIIEYAKIYPRLCDAVTQDAHDDWSGIVSNLNTEQDQEYNRIDYGNPEENPMCNIKARGGIWNMLNVLAKIIPTDDMTQKWSQEPQQFHEQIAQKLDYIFDLFSRQDENDEADDCILDWNIKGEKSIQDPVRADLNITINGNSAFDWSFQGNHFLISKNDSGGCPNEVAWQNENLKNFPLFQGWFLKEKDLKDIQALEPFHIYSLDLRDADIVLQVVDKLLAKEQKEFYLLFHKWVKNYLLDEQSLTKLKAMLYGHFDKIQNIFPKDFLEKVKILDKNEKEAKKYFETSLDKFYISSIKRLIESYPNFLNMKIWGDFPLHIAVRENHLDLVKFLIEKGADKDIKSDEGTLLIIATLKNNEDIVRFLLENGANPDIAYNGYNGNKSALDIACLKNYSGIVALLMQYNANPNIANLYGKRASLHPAIENNHTEAVRALLENAKISPNLELKKEDGEKFLGTAILEQNPEIVELLLKYGASTDNFILDASQRKNVTIVQLLLNAKADPNIQDNQDKTPLHYVSENGNVDGITLLLNANANPNFQDNEGKTPLHYASKKGNVDGITLLLNANANPNFQDNKGKTPLHYAAHLQIIEALIKNGAKTNIQDNMGKTPLHYIVNYENSDVVKVLLEYKADPNIKDNEGNTPLFYAVYDPKIVQVLLEYKTDPNIINHNEQTPFHAAILKSHSLEVLELLIKYGGNPNLKDKGGHTPLDLANMYGNNVRNAEKVKEYLSSF